MHAVEEAHDDGLTRFDLEAIILSGKVVERQQDGTTGDWKYLVTGYSGDDQLATVVIRLGLSGLLVLVTVFRESDES